MGLQRIAATTFGFLYRRSLDDALRVIAEAGYTEVELAAGPPHLDVSGLGADERARLRKQLNRLGLRCVSANPLELNPVTANPELFEAAHRQYRASLELCSDLGAGHVVMVAGRRSPLVPMPLDETKQLLVAQLERLLPVAERLGVGLTLEPVPYGFIETALDAAAFLQEFEIQGLGLTLDCANEYFAGADPCEELKSVAPLVEVVHISDTWRDRWAHTRVGQGEVDFLAFARALRLSRYEGPTVYELADDEDPAPRLREDLERLRDWGWAP